MAAASKVYLKSIYKRFLYLATWFPNTNLKLGDVGIIKDDSFKQMTTLKELGLPFKVRTGNDKVDFTYTSESGVSLKTKAAGEVAVGTALPLAEAGVALQFSKEGAFLFQAVGCIIDEIEDKATLGQSVISFFKQGFWEKDWAVIDTLVRAECATIVVSNSGSAALDLTAKIPIAGTNLANPSAGLTVSSQSGDVVRFIAEKGMSPLFRLSRVKQSVFSLLGDAQPTFGGAPAEETDEPLPEDVLEAVVPE